MRDKGRIHDTFDFSTKTCYILFNSLKKEGMVVIDSILLLKIAYVVDY